MNRNVRSILRMLPIMFFAFEMVFYPLPGNAQDYVSIIQLRSRLNNVWRQTYETEWRSVSVNVIPSIPEVPEIPVLKINRDIMEPNIHALGNGWSGRVLANGAYRADHGYNEKLEKLHKSNPGVESISAIYDPPFIYEIDSRISFNEIMEAIRQIVKLLSEDGLWYCEEPERFIVNSFFDKNQNKKLEQEQYYVHLTQVLHNIPVFAHILFHVEKVNDSERLLDPPSINFSLFSLDEIGFTSRKVMVEEILCDDVPLCDFDTIRLTLENEIMAGHIREISDIRLGYVICNEPGVTTRTPNREKIGYYAVPAWRINCVYVDNPEKELCLSSDSKVPDRTAIEYKSLIIFAQTGKLFDRYSKESSRGDYQGFISWENVGNANETRD